MSRKPVVLGPRLRRLLIFVLFLFAALAINSIYLGFVSLVEWAQGTIIQNHFYQWMFLAHLILGLMLIIPALLYGVLHWGKARFHRNRRAVKAGYALFLIMIALLLTGLLLTRGLPWFELRDASMRSVAYWLHIGTPLLLVWLFVLHRLAGKPIRWRSGAGVLALALGVSAIAIVLQSQDPRRWNQTGPISGEQYFFPSLARTLDGQFIKPESLMMDQYCQECHQDSHAGWSNSVHRFSSFNNPVYAFSVRQTRDFLQQRDGNVQAVRFCAGCHDPVPFFSGAMDTPNFGDNGEATAQAGITCSVCHSITHINSNRGNADYTIEAPLHYPFAFSEHPGLQWVNKTLVKAKPEFHKKTFLKPLHQSAEFCGSCHKVHLPEELNGYRWLRGQNHYDSFLLSGVSGHGLRSFYYPDQAQSNCNGCHMKLLASNDFGAKRYEDTAELSIHDHLFPAANTGIQSILNLPASVLEAHKQVLQGSLRVDIFGIREAGRIDGDLLAPLGRTPTVLEPGKRYLIEVVVRTLTLGHHFTQGTADSNQVWLNLTATSPKGVLAESGALQAPAMKVDPDAHFVNAYVIDRDGQRIDRRNPENIFTQLYNNQIPPGASDVVRYLLEVPEDHQGDINLSVVLKYRKFDTQYLQYIQADDFRQNDLPIVDIAADQISLPVAGAVETKPTLEDQDAESPQAQDWERWNDYGIGLLRREQFRQAEQAFRRVEQLGQGLGALNLARVYLQEGRLDEAADALQRARQGERPAFEWSVNYFTARLNHQNGFFDEAIAAYQSLLATEYPDARARGFDFSRDYRVINELAAALADRAKLERGKNSGADDYRREAILWHQKALEIDSENAVAHYGLAQLYELLGDAASAQKHRELHAKYKVDDNAADVAIQLARSRDPAADRAANKIVIYPLAKPSASTMAANP